MKISVRDVLMLLFAVTWSVIMIVIAVKSGQWPDGTSWGGLVAGELVIMAAFKGDRPPGNGDKEAN